MTLLEKSAALYADFRRERGAGNAHTALIRTFVLNTFGHDGLMALGKIDREAAPAAHASTAGGENGPASKLRRFVHPLAAPTGNPTAPLPGRQDGGAKAAANTLKVEETPTAVDTASEKAVDAAGGETADGLTEEQKAAIGTMSAAEIEASFSVEQLAAHIQSTGVRLPPNPSHRQLAVAASRVLKLKK